MEQSFELARESQTARAVVLFMQANPWAAPTGRYCGYRELIDTS